MYFTCIPAQLKAVLWFLWHCCLLIFSKVMFPPLHSPKPNSYSKKWILCLVSLNEQFSLFVYDCKKAAVHITIKSENSSQEQRWVCVSKRDWGSQRNEMMIYFLSPPKFAWGKQTNRQTFSRQANRHFPGQGDGRERDLWEGPSLRSPPTSLCRVTSVPLLTHSVTVKSYSHSSTHRGQISSRGGSRCFQF